MNYNVKVVELFIIYSIYALALINIGDYESDIRKSFVVKSDRFSLYTSKINGYHNTISIIIPSGIFIVLLSAIISIFFNAWMVEYMLIGDQNMSSRYGLYESFKNIFNLAIRERDNKRKKIASLFLVTILILIIEFILTNIAIVYSIADSLNLYIFQYIALNIIGVWKNRAPLSLIVPLASACPIDLKVRCFFTAIDSSYANVISTQKV